ncbi:MAG: hypothetical protein M1536_06400 [Firmicutes bacterium]|nr:hypothetical protein [Bacillota bacterium]
MRKGAIALFQDSLTIFRDNLSKMFFMVIFAVIPIIGDSLHTCVVQQIKNKEDVSVKKALMKALKYFWRLFEVNFLFSLSMNGWMLVPVYGWIKVIYYSFYSTMISNVVILEELSGTAAMKRCRELIMRTKETTSFSLKFLILIPVIPVIVYLIFYVFSMSNIIMLGEITLIFTLISFFVFAPVFEVANSLLYYELIRREVEDGAASAKVKEILGAETEELIAAARQMEQLKPRFR